MNEITLEESFAEGSGNRSTTDINQVSLPMVVRGVTSKSEIEICKTNSRDFYYIDTGYVGNFPSKGNHQGKKLWHRVVKNDLQLLEPIDVPDDRWKKLIEQDSRLKWSDWKNYDQKILLVLPNPKACRFYNVDCDTWVQETTELIRTYSNLPIEVRIKGSRVDRNHGYSIYNAFDSGVFATVSFNSIASLESVLYGIPSFISVPCAASTLSSTDLSTLKNPHKPTLDEIESMCKTIAYGQFTKEELHSGYAWKVLNEITNK